MLHFFLRVHVGLPPQRDPFLLALIFLSLRWKQPLFFPLYLFLFQLSFHLCTVAIFSQILSCSMTITKTLVKYNKKAKFEKLQWKLPLIHKISCLWWQGIKARASLWKQWKIKGRFKQPKPRDHLRTSDMWIQLLLIIWESQIKEAATYVRSHR